MTLEAFEYKNPTILGFQKVSQFACLFELVHLQNRIPEAEIIDFKEALIFGLLGVLRLREENNCLASVTGAPQDHSSGMIFQP